MSHLFAIALFAILMGALGMLVVWEHRLRKRGPVVSAETFQKQLGDSPKIAYDPPRERLRRSMDRKR
jgi:hypothetical protein